MIFFYELMFMDEMNDQLLTLKFGNLGFPNYNVRSWSFLPLETLRLTNFLSMKKLIMKHYSLESVLKCLMSMITSYLGNLRFPNFNVRSWSVISSIGNSTFDHISCNEEVDHSFPHWNLYWNSFFRLSVLISTVVSSDSFIDL